MKTHRAAGNEGERATQVVALYQKQLIHDEPQDLLVDILTELRSHSHARGWDFTYAVRRSAEEAKRWGFIFFPLMC